VTSDIIEVKGSYICNLCGVVANNVLNISSEDISHTINADTISHKPKYLNKYHEWTLYTNEEKNSYRLYVYTTQLCRKLEIPDHLSQTVSDYVLYVMETVKKYDGTKRAKVKDGIILVCIQYVYKEIDSFENSKKCTVTLAKKLGIDVKYITKAETLILEMINAGKLKMSKNFVVDTPRAFDYVREVINKQQMQVPKKLCEQVKRMIDICEREDILSNHTPLSIGVSCFYYILLANDIKLDIKSLAELYDMSFATIQKTYAKLTKRFNN
jgi:transcription initiation factor TFIIIB Brf1 subunit/transcription initiation factor TFIIB